MATQSDHDAKPELWQIPEVDVESDEETTNALNMPHNWFHQPEVEAEEEQAPPAPPSLEEIEAIRQAAYQEGFEQGQTEGFAQGEQRGHSEGYERGHEEGLAQGIEQGLVQGEQQINEQTLRWQQLMAQLANPLSQLTQDVELQLVQLALQLSQQIVRTEVTTNPQVVLTALKQAIDVLPFANQTMHLHFHPDDVDMINQVYSAEECDKRGWVLIAEPSLQRGDCQIKTELSSVDYPLEMRINQVLKQFLAANNQHMNEARAAAEQQVAAQVPKPPEHPTQTPDVSPFDARDEANEENAVNVADEPDDHANDVTGDLTKDNHDLP
ncbi:flagellar assembly protein FliH [Motilimonas eburnea]|uniref:flagellar assembly protein FliH n=1 Tax=Motilimonas eburnea TaxID=1737488 RepID=UPI001E640ABB|nr:flagellar assembly protein FliH [Motilimonas eburnea]MCE2571514.1 flagellar assembly protein FliH [Motilimonas eburnea]